MQSFGMLGRVDFAKIDVSEESCFTIIRVILMMEAIRSSETSVLTRVTRPNIPENDILHSHRRENLKFYRI
jgi:hypothetical protein